MPNLARLFTDFLRTAPTEDVADFYEYKKKQLQPEQPPQPTYPRGVLLPPTRPRGAYLDEPLPVPGGEGAGSMPVIDYSDLPQIAPPPPDPLTARIANQRQRTRELSDPNDPRFRPVTNNDRGPWGRLGDILRQFVISAGQGWDKSDPRLDPRQRLAGAIGGGIGGGVYAGFHPEVDEERKRIYDIAYSKQKEAELIELQKQQQADFKSRQEALARQQGLITNQPVPVSLADGRTVYTTGRDAYGQSQSAIRQQAGFENQAEHQKRGQDFQRAENQKTRDNNYAIAVASAQTAADRHRVENEIQADRDHANAVEDYYRRKANRLLEISKLAGGTTGSKLHFDTLLNQTRANLDRARALDDQISTEASKGSSADRRLINSLTRQRDTLMRQIDESNQKLATAAANAGVSASQVEALRKAEAEDRYPTRRTVPTYTPTTPQRPGSYSAQGKVYPSPSALRPAFPGKSDAQIRQIVESQGGRFQN